MVSAVPAHLVLGGLGVGKTSTILELLKSAPPDQTWAVFVNEFGRVPIDPELFNGEARDEGRFVVHESRGGCICCSGALDLAVGIQEIVTNFQPDRLIIEPTGLSNPILLKDQLLKNGDRWGVSLESCIGVLDVRLVGHERFKEMPFVRSIVACSDHILGSKADLTDDGVITRFVETVGQWTPDPAQIHISRDMLSDANWTQPAGNSAKTFFFQQQEHSQQILNMEESELPGSRGRRFIENSSTHTALGWIFSANVSFDKQVLFHQIREITANDARVVRLKGILRTSEDWKVVQYSKGDVPTAEDCNAREDSRMEIIFEGSSVDANLIEAGITGCIA